jgi:peptidoglycan/xylan/chitin deacetylase (PgdA/CDA1 family)
VNKHIVIILLLMMLLQAVSSVSAAKTKVIIIFDDGWTSDYYKALPIMQTNNQQATAFIITGEVAEGTGLQGLEYMNMSQLNALYSAGWDLSSHTVTHPHLTTLSTSQLNTELRNSKNWLNSSGFTRASMFLAYPYGEYSDNIISAVKANGYLAARTVNNDLTHPQFTLASPLIYELPTLIVSGVPGYGDPATSVSDIENQINKSIASNGLVIHEFRVISKLYQI